MCFHKILCLWNHSHKKYTPTSVHYVNISETNWKTIPWNRLCFFLKFTSKRCYSFIRSLHGDTHYCITDSILKLFLEKKILIKISSVKNKKSMQVSCFSCLVFPNYNFKRHFQPPFSKPFYYISHIFFECALLFYDNIFFCNKAFSPWSIKKCFFFFSFLKWKIISLL